MTNRRTSPYVVTAIACIAIVFFASLLIRTPTSQQAPTVKPLDTRMVDGGFRVETLRPLQSTDLEGMDRGIGSAELVLNGRVLLISDGTVIGPSGVDLLVMSTRDLSRLRTFTMTDQMTAEYPWSSGSIVAGPKGASVLLYNQQIRLAKLTPGTALRVREALGMPNVCPEPLSISPNGQLAAVCVGSYLSHDQSVLCIFDLQTGSLKRTLAAGKDVEYGNACFLSDEVIAVWKYSGAIDLVNITSGETVYIPGKAPSPIIPFSGKNLAMRSFNNGQNLLLSGSDEIAVLDVGSRRFLFRCKSDGANAFVGNGGSLVICQGISSRKKRSNSGPMNGLIPTTALHVLDAANGQLIGEVILPKRYDLFLTTGTSLFALSRDAVVKFRFDLSGFKRSKNTVQR